jgi:hypothetical protein
VKYFYFLLALVIPFIAEAQSGRKKQETDSLSYYSGELGRLSRANRDSFHKSEPYVAATAGYYRHLRHSNDYSSFTLFFDVFGSDYSQLNKMLAADGFPALNETGGRVGFGISYKVNRGIVDMNFIVAGLSNKSEKGNEKISTSFSNVFQFDLGYDLLKSKIVSLYPYAGLALRISTLKYTEKGVHNPNYTSLSDMVIGGKEISMESTRIGYQLGVGFDIKLWQDKEGFTRNMLFIKGGMNRPMWKDKFNIGDLPDYNAGIKQGQWIITVGFKFGTKQ